jgi:protein-tyrosine-phosphatase/predicted ATP-grasp superfamily ATP-dependent carboligase
MSAPTGRVLILGDDTRAFLTVARSLGRRGLETHAAWCPLDSPALRSRHIHRTHRLPEYSPANRRWLDALIGLLRETAFDLVIPCHDSGLLPLQRHRAELEPLARIALIGDEAFEVFFSKRKTYELGRELAIPLPRQTVARSLAELEAAAEEFGYPLVLKPQASAAIDNPWSRLSVKKARDRAALRRMAESMRVEEGVLAQENFRGRGTGVEVLCRHGEVLTAFQHLRVHEPLDGGGSSYRKSVPLDPGMLEATRKLMRATRYTGVAMAEYKVDPQSGKWILIEVNPRFWGSLPLTVAAGLDFPSYLYDLLAGRDGPFPQEYRAGLYARNWLNDLYWMRANLEADRRDPDLMTLPMGKVAAEIVNVVTLRERSDTITLDDPMPGLAELAEFGAERWRGWLERTAWHRRRLERRAVEALQRSRRVLFLCYGNICRSPFAEHALRALGTGRESASTGYHPADGRRSPAAAIEAASTLGIDMSGHRSRIWTPEAIAAADIILIFDRKHRARLAAVYPEALAKTHYLGALDAGGALEIEDPWGENVERFQATYSRILELLKRAGTGQSPATA